MTTTVTKRIRSRAYSIEEIRRYNANREIIDSVRNDVFSICDANPREGQWTRQDWHEWELTWIAIYKNISDFIREVKKENVLSLLPEASKLANTMLNARHVMNVKKRSFDFFEAQV